MCPLHVPETPQSGDAPGADGEGLIASPSTMLWHIDLRPSPLRDRTCSLPDLEGIMVDVRIVILAAGVGNRLGMPHPKPLTVLADGRSIMATQIDNIATHFSIHDVSIVVGFKKDMIMEAFPDVSFIYNQNYGDTNTSKSLLKALQVTGSHPVLWMNGDVVFDPALLDGLMDLVASGQSFVCVNHERVGDEEVKYTLGDDGFIAAISKVVEGGLGEAVGINFVSTADKPALIRHLESCNDDDFFERGIESAISEDGLRVLPVDISANRCLEVDFPEDLARALSEFP